MWKAKCFLSAAAVRALPALLILAAGLHSAAGAPMRHNAIGGDYTAVAKPWRDVNLSFSRPGRVVRILVHRGQTVKRGQLLAEQNDRSQKIAAAVARLSAVSRLRIQAAEAELAQDQVSLKRTLWAAAKHAATAFEVRRAQLKVTIDELSLKLAELKHQHDVLAWQAAELAVARRQLRAPFDGMVEDRFIDAGRSVNAFKKVLQLVQIKRLRIFVSVPLDVAMRLRVGAGALVHPTEGVLGDGKIRWIASLADSGSNTLTVEISDANPRAIPAAQQVQVRFLGRDKSPAHPARGGAPGISAAPSGQRGRQ